MLLWSKHPPKFLSASMAMKVLSNLRAFDSLHCLSRRLEGVGLMYLACCFRSSRAKLSMQASICGPADVGGVQSLFMYSSGIYLMTVGSSGSGGLVTKNETRLTSFVNLSIVDSKSLLGAGVWMQ